MNTQKAKTTTAMALETRGRLHSASKNPAKAVAKSVPQLRMRSKSDLAALPNPYAVSSRIYRPSSSTIFDYNLSPVEQQHFRNCSDPMKSVPAAELELLRSGQRSTYLERRYEHSPDDKYNYPEATSWRYGWFHCQSEPCQKRHPRKD